MQVDQSVEQRLELITRGLPECPGQDAIKEILQAGRNPKGTWITVPTGRPHLGYFVPLIKIVDLLRAGVDFTVCLGDFYAYLINFRYPLEQVAQRKIFYRSVLSAVIETIGVPSAQFRFIEESSYALSSKHVIDHFRLCALASQHDICQTGDEVANSTMFGPMLTPGLQALDEEYHDADFALGGLDQRGLFSFAEHFLPKLGYKARAHIMNDMLMGLDGSKMSASLPEFKIDCLDSPETVRRKISEIRCEEGQVQGNGLLAIMKLVLIPISNVRLERLKGITGANPEEGQGDLGDQQPFCSLNAPEGTKFTIVLSPAEAAESKHYNSYEEIERDYASKKLPYRALKIAVVDAINSLLAHVRKRYDNDKEWQAAEKIAYPETEEEFLSTHQAGNLGSAPPLEVKASYDVNFVLPFRELSNDRVKLVPFDPSVHASAFFNISQPHQAALWAHMGPGPFNSERDFKESFVEAVIRANEGIAMYAVIDKTRPATREDRDGALAGIMSFINTSLANQCTEIGYIVILPAFQRTHITTNAVGLMLEHALEAQSNGGWGLRRVAWQTSSANLPSQHAAERMGFQKEGVLRWNTVFYNSTFRGKVGNGRSMPHWGEEKDLSRDTVVYSMCWDDWENGGRDRMHDLMLGRRTTNEV